MHPLINAYLTLRRLERVVAQSKAFEQLRLHGIREAYRLISEYEESDPHVANTWEARR